MAISGTDVNVYGFITDAKLSDLDDIFLINGSLISTLRPCENIVVEKDDVSFVKFIEPMLCRSFCMFMRRDVIDNGAYLKSKAVVEVSPYLNSKYVKDFVKFDIEAKHTTWQIFYIGDHMHFIACYSDCA